MTFPETPRDNPETFIQTELKRLQLDRAAFLVDVGIDEAELKSIIQRSDVQVMFRLDLESPEIANLNALEIITSWVLMAYQSMWDTPMSIKEFVSKPLPQGTAPEVRFAHWKLRQIAKLDSHNKTYMKVDAMWKKLQTASSQALPPRAQWETETGFLDRAKNFIWEHKVVSSLIGIGWATLLYKLFGSSGKSEGEKDKWFFNWLMEKIPNMWFLGVIVALVWLWYFRDDIRGWFKKWQETVEVAGKVMDIKKAIIEFADPATSMTRRMEIGKALVEQVGKSVKPLIAAAAAKYGINLDQWSPLKPQWDKPQEGEPTGNLLPIGIARGTQFYYGTWKPWTQLKPAEQNIIRWTVSNWFTGWFSKGNINYDQVVQRIPAIEWEIAALETTVPAKSQELLGKLTTGNGAFEWKDWKDALKLEHIEKQVISNMSWALPVIFSGLDDASKKLIAEHFAKQEIDLLVQWQRTLVNAIRQWPAEYGKFLASRWDATLLYDRMRTLEAARNGLDLNNLQKITPDDWKKFSQLAEEHLSLIREKDALLATKRAQMLEIQQAIAADNSKKTILEPEFQRLASEYAQVENDVMKSTHEMLTKEKAMVRVLESAWLAHASWNPFHNFMVNRWWLAQSHHAETMGDLRMVSPGKSGLLRMWFSKWNFVLMGVWVGAVLYANGKNIDGAKHDLERMAWGLVPLIWGAMDVRDAWKDFWEGRLLHGFANLWAATASYSWDALLALSLIPAGTTAPLGIGAKWALAGLRGFLKGLWVEWAQSVAIKEALPESWKLVLNVVDASGKAVEKTVELTPEWKNAWKWIQERMAPQRERITSLAKMGLIWGIWAMLVAWPGMVLASYAFDKDAGAQKLV